MWNVLVVDDNFINRKLIVEILKNKAACDVAASVPEAREAYDLSVKESRPYDIIFLDVAMPEVSGLELLKYIREDERRRGILLGHGVPIVMVTAFKDHFLKAFSSGCDDYILKPFTSVDLLSKAEEHIKPK